MSDLIGLFHAKYRTSGPPGAPTLHLDLLVNTPKKTITGTATVTQAITPPHGPTVFKGHVVGVYSVMTVMGPVTHIQLKLHGVLLGDGSLEDANPNATDANPLFDAIIVLDDKWEAGEAHYSYLNHPTQLVQPITAVHD